MLRDLPMGQAKNRGTPEERIAAAKEKKREAIKARIKADREKPPVKMSPKVMAALAIAAQVMTLPTPGERRGKYPNALD